MTTTSNENPVRDAIPNQVEGDPKPSPRKPRKHAINPSRTVGEILTEAAPSRSRTFASNTRVRQILKPETIGATISSAS
jgi:hypothetical protein